MMRETDWGQDASVAEKIGCLKREQLTWDRVAA